MLDFVWAVMICIQGNKSALYLCVPTKIPFIYETALGD